MDIQQYIAADKELLLNLNGSQSLFWDGFMWVATSTIFRTFPSNTRPQYYVYG